MDNALALHPLPTVEAVDPLTDERWSQLSEAHGSVFTSPPWLRALAGTYGFDIGAWLRFDDRGVAVGGIPFARLSDEHGPRLSTLPFSDFCNPIDGDGSAWPAFVDLFVAERHPFEVRFLGDPGVAADERLAMGTSALWHAIDLDEDEGRAWDSLAGSARRAIRKAREAGIEIRAVNDASTLRAFYELHLGVRKHKYGLFPQPFDFFETLRETFGDRLTLLGAWHGDTMIACILYLAWGDTFYYKFNASSGDRLDVRPNDLLMWEGMRYASSLGLQVVDLGRTDADHESLARYKSKYATRQGEIAVVRHGLFKRDTTLGSVLGPITQLLTRPDVPDEVTEEAARAVYRHFA
jgi:Acetyltransferase (GNAT) domain